MPGIEIILAALMPCCLAASAVFSSSETALFSLTQADRLRLRRINPGAYAAVTRLLASPRSLLIAVLIGNVTVNSAYYVLAAAVGKAFFDTLGQLAFGIGALLVMIAMGEVLPKSIAAAHRVPFCRLLARPLVWCFVLVRPIHAFAEGFAVAPLVRVLVPRHADDQNATLSAQELAALLEKGARTGVLESQEQRLMGEVVRLSSVRVREVMVPRVDVSYLTSGAVASDVFALVRETGQTRFLLCRGDLSADSIRGFIDVQRVIGAMQRDGRGDAMPVDSLAEAVCFVPDRAKLDQLLDHLRSTRSESAVCVNELGDVTGVVELDAVIGELVGVGVGASADAHGAPQVRMVALGSWEVSGRLGVRDWAEFFGDRSIASDPRVTTVAGIIIAKLGRLPRVGDEVHLGGLHLRVESLDGRVVDRVLVTLRDEGGAP
jgi:putative hemolysin